MGEKTRQAKITFPIVEGTRSRRNAETGIEIRPVASGGYDVIEPARDTNLKIVGFYRWTLADARKLATQFVEAHRWNVLVAHARAIAEDAEREQRERATDVLAMDTDPGIAAEVAEANGLDDEDAAQMVADARSVSAGAKHVAWLAMERAWAEARAEDAERDRLIRGLLRSATGFPFFARRWVSRHGFDPCEVTLEDYYRAFVADHQQAIELDKDRPLKGVAR